MASSQGKLTPFVQEQICKILASGAYVTVAAGAVGIDRVTIYSWMKKGRAQKRGKYRDFLDAVTKAKDTAEIMAVNRILQAAKGTEGLPPDWRAAAWFLEHGRQDRWRNRQSVELAGKDGAPIKVDSTQRAAPAFDLTKLSDEELAVFEALAAKMAADASSSGEDGTDDDGSDD